MRGLDGKVAIVTGATKAMGAAIAGRLAEEGVAIVGAGRTEDAGDEIAQTIRDAGGRAIFVRTDVSDDGDVKVLVERGVAAFGRIDILVNNAAFIPRRGPAEQPVVDEPFELLEQMIKVNVYGPFWLAKHAIPEMIKSGGGSIISLSSLNTARVPGAMPGYVTSKAALEALTRQIAADYAQVGVRANSILIGSIRVPSNSVLYNDPGTAETFARLRMIPRVGVPEDVASMVAFLASDDSGFTTAAVIPVDGGAHAAFTAPTPAAMFAGIERKR